MTEELKRFEKWWDAGDDIPSGICKLGPLQRQWVGLTDEERQDIALEVPMDAVCITEAKLKEKNT